MTRALVLVSVLAALGCKAGDKTDEDAQEDVQVEDVAEDAEDASDVVEEPPYLVEWPEMPWVLCTGDDEPEEATVITAFELEDQYHATESRRTIETEVEFPASGSWQAIGMKIDLGCPADGDCDNWDRFANISLVENAGTADEEEIELERYITPYNVGMCIVTDVTRFAPRLRGLKTIRSFISTWVGPDEPVHGHGWRITLEFIFHPGPPGPGLPDSVIQLWPHASVVVGDPENTVGAQMGGVRLPIPDDVTRAELRVITTGHGQGNLFNCAEFCNLNQHVVVDGTRHSYDPWRDDCALNPIGPYQAGTWQHPRSGWCPGAYVVPEIFDITDSITPGSESTFVYEILTSADETYENTCRPGAGGTDNLCDGCAFDSSPGNCDYNGGNHTEPNDRVTVQLMLYR
jgi:hypothetical protein